MILCGCICTSLVLYVTGDSASEGGRNAVSQTGSSFSQRRLEDCSNGTEISLNFWASCKTKTWSVISHWTVCLCACNRTKYMPRTSSKLSTETSRMNPVMVSTNSMKISSLPLGLQAEELQDRAPVRHFLLCVHYKMEVVWDLTHIEVLNISLVGFCIVLLLMWSLTSFVGTLLTKFMFRSTLKEQFEIYLFAKVVKGSVIDTILMCVQSIRSNIQQLISLAL